MTASPGSPSPLDPPAAKSPTPPGSPYEQPYGDLVQLNTRREILDAVGPAVLRSLVEDYLELLDTSAAVYEANGDYALGIFNSGWCRLMDAASRRRCGTSDNAAALASGEWHCHESCWHDAARPAMELGAPVDIPCRGGIRLYAVPIRAGEEIVGAINFGYGTPPADPARLAELAARYEVPVEELRREAEAYRARPPEVVEMAKRRLARSAQLIGEIVARRRAESGLHERDAEFRAMADNIPQLAWMADPSGWIYWYNQRWYDYTGTTLEEMQGWGWRAVHHPDHVERVVARIQRAWDTGEPWEDTFPLRSKDGEWRWFLSRAMPIRDAAGRVVRWFGTNTDVTEERALADALEAERAKLAAAIEHLPVGVGIGTPDGQILSLNRAGLATHGFASEEEMLWRLPEYEREFELRYTDGRIMPLEEWPMSRAMRGEFVRGYEVRLRQRATGVERVVAYDVIPVRDATGAARVHVFVMNDVTERRRAEAERQRLLEAERAARRDAEEARAAAERANRAKSQFLANMSHELRTPLNAIAGHVQLLEMGLYGALSDAQRDSLGRVQRSQRHLLQLIDDLLSFTKLDAGLVAFDVRPVRVADVVADAEPMILPQLEAKGLAYEAVLPDPDVAVWADREKLVQILLNLLSNAVKFTPAARPDGSPGRVLVEVTGREGTPGLVYLRVSDTGIGIAREQQRAIFDPFVQVQSGLTRQHEGTGLGLAISRDLAHGMGAELRVRSEPGEGATFTVALRRVEAAGGWP